jgi:hypothetical protein
MGGAQAPMPHLLVTFSILALASGGFGQVPLVSVAGQPFSADEVIIQNPKPNVHNVLPMKMIRLYRDSAGRTREDVSIPRDPIASPFVNITDPIAGVHYSLDTEKRIARRLLYPQPWTPPLNLSTAGVIMSSNKGICDFQNTFESLGTQVIEGLVADGKRSTNVLLTPKSGCDANKAVNESWYSAELKMILLEKTSNSLGDGTTRLEHIDRSEPDPRFFQAPSGYTIVELHWNEPVK